MISIVIPTYNERENIAGLINTIGIVLERTSYEIIIVDDKSPDGTARVVRGLVRENPRIRLLSHPPPRDLGRSILMGVEAAHGEVIVGMDGDGNHDPQYIPRLLDALQNTDLVVGSRFVRHEIQNIGSYLFNWLLKYFFGFPIWDNTSGFYAITKKTLLSLHPPSIYYGYGEYHLRLVYKAMQKQLKIVEVPVAYPPRRHGQSKSRLFIMLLTYVWTAFRLKNLR